MSESCYMSTYRGWQTGRTFAEDMTPAWRLTRSPNDRDGKTFGRKMVHKTVRAPSSTGSREPRVLRTAGPWTGSGKGRALPVSSNPRTGEDGRLDGVAFILFSLLRVVRGDVLPVTSSIYVSRRGQLTTRRGGGVQCYILTFFTEAWCPPFVLPTDQKNKN